MASGNNTPIQLYYSNTSGSVPLSANLIIGELAINVPDGKLFYKDKTNTVNVIASTSSVLGYYNHITFTGDSTQQYTAAAPYAYSNANFALANTNATNITIIQGVDARQNADIASASSYGNSAFDKVNSAYGFANTVYSNYAYPAYENALAAGSYANSAFSKANSGYAVANTATTNITNIQGVDLTQNTSITASFVQANAAFEKANTVGLSAAQIQGVDDTQNTSISAAFTQANSAYTTANTNTDAITALQGVNLTQNSSITAAGSYANSAFTVANTNAGNITVIQGVDLKQNTDITSATNLAQAAYNFANTLSGGTASDGIARDLAASAFTQANAAFVKANNALANTDTITVANNVTIPGHANVYHRLSVGTGSYQVLPNLIAQFTGTSDYYSQVNQQNLSGKGTADFVATADNGTDSANYADMGMAGGEYDNTSPNAFPFVQPNDGYFMVVGNSGQNFGGNVYLGTAGSGSYADISFVQGNTFDETARFKYGGNIEFYRPLVANSFTTKDGVNVVTYTNTANTYLQGLIGNKVDKSGDTINGTLNISDATSANALVVTGNVAISQDLRVSGNLFVGGNSTSVSANNLTLTDSLIYLADNNPADVVDIGIIGAYNNGTYQHTGLARDAHDGKWKLFSNVVAEPTTTIDFTGAGYDTLYLGTVEAANNIVVKGTDLQAFANAAFLKANSAYGSSNNKVATVSGTTGRVTSSGTTAITLDLDTTGVTPGTYSYPQIQVDAYGRTVSISNQTPVTSFNTRTGAISLVSGDVTGALGYTPTNSSTYTADQLLQQGVDSRQNTNIGSASTYANGAFIQANAAYGFANTVYSSYAYPAYENALAAGSYANSAFTAANSSGSYANSAFSYANTVHSEVVTVGIYANTAFTYANSAGDYANAAFAAANNAYNAGGITSGAYANAAFTKANSAYESQNTTGTYANSAYTQANTATNNAAGASQYANSAYIQANAAFNQANTGVINAGVADAKAVVAGSYANSAFGVANTALSNAAVADEKAVTSGDYANSAFVKANSAYTKANTVTSAATYANGAFLQANSAFEQANTAEADAQIAQTIAISAGQYANASFLKANAAFRSQNTTGIYANSAFEVANIATDIGITAGSYANSAYNKANTADTKAVSAGSYANSAFVQANSAYDLAQGGFDLANTNASNITLVQGVDLRQNTNITNAGTYANGAFRQANAAFEVANTAASDTLVAGSYANSAYNQANTATTNAATADSKAVTAGSYANSAYTQANSASALAQDAYNAANTAGIGSFAFIQANAAYNLANTNASGIIAIQGVDTWQNTYISTVDANATSAGVYANAAFAAANSGSSAASAAIYANGAFVQANAAFDVANVSGVYANSSYTQANSSYVLAQAAYNKANTSATFLYTASATPPASPGTSDLWYDTTTDILYQWITSDGTTFFWVDIDSPTVTSANTTISYTYTGYGRAVASAIVFGGF